VSARDEATGKALQHLVAHCMAVAVVDALEVVGVDYQQ
jgi:hypothetical protein